MTEFLIYFKQQCAARGHPTRGQGFSFSVRPFYVVEELCLWSSSQLIPFSSQQHLPAKCFHTYISSQFLFLRNISLSSITHFFTYKYYKAPKCNTFKTERITSGSLFPVQVIPTQVMVPRQTQVFIFRLLPFLPPFFLKNLLSLLSLLPSAH